MGRFPDRLGGTQYLGCLDPYRLLCFACLIALVTACAFPRAVRPTVKIGLVAPFEGRYRYLGYDVIYAVRLALQEVNQEGGVAGYGVELAAYDDGAHPATAVEQARKLDVDPAVVGAVGHFRQETTAAAVEVYDDAGLALVAPGVLDPSLSPAQEPVYRLGLTADPVARALLDRASRFAPDGDVVLVGEGGPLEEALRRAAGQHTPQRLPAISTNGDGWEMDVLVRDPSVLIVALDPVPAGEIVSALRRSGWAGRVIGGPALGAGDFVSVAGDSAVGCTFVTPWPFPADIPGGDDFAAAYRRVSGGSDPGPLALPAYEGAWTLLQALEEAAAAGRPTRQRVAAALSHAERAGTLEKLSVRDGQQWMDLGLYWYQIGPRGVVSLAPES